MSGNYLKSIFFKKRAKPQGEQAPPSTAPEKRKPPQSLKPHAREAWDRVPPEVQEEFHRLDVEVRRTLQETAQKRKAGDEYEEVLAPYRGLLTAPPKQVLGGLLETAKVLQVGTPQQKAQVIAQAIGAYGVDIDALDKLLSGQAPQGQQQGERPGPEAYRDPRVDLMVEEARRRKEEKTRREIDEFAGENEFFADVAEDIVAIRQAASARGSTMSLKEAYDRACWANPEVRKVLAQRQEAASRTVTQAATQRTLAAASSVKTEPAPGIGGTGGGGSVMDDVHAARSSLSGRR